MHILNGPAIKSDLNWERSVTPEQADQKDAEWHPKCQPIKLSYKRQNKEPAFTQDDKLLIYKGEVLVLIASPGAGKSNWVESAIATIIADKLAVNYEYSLGLNCPCVTPATRILAVDLERTHDDVDSSHKRILRRLEDSDLLIKDDQIPGLDYLPMIDLDDITQKRDEIIGHLTAAQNEGMPYDFVFLDGGLDLCEDMNDSKLAPSAARWVRWLAATFNVAVVITLHPNKNSETAAGAFGTYLNRYCRSFLLIKTVPNTDGLRVITTDFDLGKLSHDSGRIEHYFSWNHELGFFTSDSDTTMPIHKKIRQTQPELEKVVKGIFQEKMTTTLAATEFKPVLMKKLGCKESLAKLRLSEAKEFGYLIQSGTGRSAYYSLPGG